MQINGIRLNEGHTELCCFRRSSVKHLKMQICLMSRREKVKETQTKTQVSVKR